jgi:hypothetical protein
MISMRAFKNLSKSDKRIASSRKRLESAVTEAVKSAPDCEAFVGVIIQRMEPKSRTEPNWAIRGVRFGSADRDKSGNALANVVERMQLEFSLTDNQDDALQAKALKWEVIPIRRDEEGVSIASEHDQD